MSEIKELCGMLLVGIFSVFMDLVLVMVCVAGIIGAAFLFFGVPILVVNAFYFLFCYASGAQYDIRIAIAIGLTFSILIMFEGTEGK